MSISRGEMASVCVVVAVASGHAMARGHDYMGVSIFDKAVMRWNSSDIAGTQQAIAPVVSLFALGVEFDSPGNGWYVVSYDSTAGSPLPGFYRMIGGASTKLAEMPFRTPAVAGLERSQDGSVMYTILNRDWLSSSSPYELYSVDFAGAFTKVATLSFPGVQTPDIDGLARNPATGELYFVERHTHTGELYKIDPVSLKITDIGSLGVFATGATNLAFSKDGSELVCLTNLYKLYSVNPATGATTLLGSSPSPFADFEAVPAPGACAVGVAVGAVGVWRRSRR